MITVDSVLTAVAADMDDHFIKALSDMPALTELLENLQETQIEILKGISVSSLL